MFSFIQLLALSIPLLAYASADASATCNPLSASCEPEKALATSFATNFNEESDLFDVYSTPDEIFYGDDGLTLTLAKRFDNPSLKSNFAIMFGKVEVILKAASGTGIVSSFYLQSNDLDEIDLEWVGGDGYHVQSNYFSKGNTATYDRGGMHAMADPRADFHNYTIEWNENEINWIVDSNVVRTLTPSNSQGFPQSPMYLYMGIWAGGDPSNAEGTIEWAGGVTDYSDAPFSMYIQRLVVSDYSTGTEYKYGDHSGTWESIEAVGGSVNGREAQANAEFAELVNGAEISQNSENSSSFSSSSPFSSSSSSPSSSSLSSSSSQAKSTTPSTSELSSKSTSSKATKSNTESTSSEVSSTTSTSSKAQSTVETTSSSPVSSTLTTSRVSSTSSETTSSENSISTLNNGADSFKSGSNSLFVSVFGLVTIAYSLLV